MSDEHRPPGDGAAGPADGREPAEQPQEQAPVEPVAEPAPGPPAPRNDALRFVLGFAIIFGALYAAFTWWDLVRVHFVAPWTETVATVSRVTLNLLGESIHQHGNVIYVRGYGLDIVDGCNGITPLSLLVAGVLAFPTRWRARLWGLLLGVPAVLFVNLVRIVVLWYLGLHYPEWFDRSHLYVAQAFVILATGGVWLWWLGRFGAPASAHGIAAARAA